MNLVTTFIEQIKTVIADGVFGFSLVDTLIIVMSVVLAILVKGVFARFIVNRIKNIVLRSVNTIDDSLFNALKPPIELLPFVLVFLIISLYIDLQSTLGLYFQKINHTLSTIFVFWLIHQALIPFSFFFNKLGKILSKALTQWLLRAIKYLIIFLGVVAVLEVWGIKIGPVIAGLGLFGVAVALGAQDLFKNLISGIMILLEKRFQLGDVINVPGHTEGTVEHIGFRSTVIRKYDSTPISIPNYIFAEAPILNYSNRKHRRINWIIGLEYSTDIEQIRNIIADIENYIINCGEYIIDEDHQFFVKLNKFNDSSIDLLIYAFTVTNNWKDYLGIKEKLAFEIKNVISKNGASFAFPSTSVYIEKS